MSDIKELDQKECDPYRHVQKVLINKWKPFILMGLWNDQKSRRFSRFSKILGISEKVLSLNLRELEKDLLIRRVSYPGKQLHVEYELTESGISACKLLLSIYEWAWEDMRKKNLPIDKSGEIWHQKRAWDEDYMRSLFTEDLLSDARARGEQNDE